MFHLQTVKSIKTLNAKSNRTFATRKGSSQQGGTTRKPRARRPKVSIPLNTAPPIPIQKDQQPVTQSKEPSQSSPNPSPSSTGSQQTQSVSTGGLLGAVAATALGTLGEGITHTSRIATSTMLTGSQFTLNSLETVLHVTKTAGNLLGNSPGANLVGQAAEGFGMVAKVGKSLVDGVVDTAGELGAQFGRGLQVAAQNLGTSPATSGPTSTQSVQQQSGSHKDTPLPGGPFGGTPPTDIHGLGTDTKEQIHIPTTSTHAVPPPAPISSQPARKTKRSTAKKQTKKEDEKKPLPPVVAEEEKPKAAVDIKRSEEAEVNATSF